jgi:hypothetical protein
MLSRDLHNADFMVQKERMAFLYQAMRQAHASFCRQGSHLHEYRGSF